MKGKNDVENFINVFTVIPTQLLNPVFQVFIIYNYKVTVQPT